MIKILIIISLLYFTSNSLSQSYAPPAGQIGSFAIAKDSSIIIDWASDCVVTRGYMDASDTGLGFVSNGQDTSGIGIADGNTVSLGDGGDAILTFSQPIINDIGPDFVIFENAFIETFLELAFVEVSSDGVNFFRFPAVSETQTTTQIDGFGSVDCRYIHNLAGKYKVNFGTPFDLDDVVGIAGLNVNAITHVKIIDVVGSIDSLYASIDMLGNYINDPFPTPYSSSGFDLDAVGVIHQESARINEMEANFKVYPNPTSNKFIIESKNEVIFTLTNLKGEIIKNGSTFSQCTIDLTEFNSGVYLLKLMNKNGLFTKKIIKL